MVRFYLVPAEVITVAGTRYCGPKYFTWKSPACQGTGTLPRIEHADYGFVSAMLVAADLTDAQRAELLSHTDVFEFAANLDSAVDKAAIAPFFEGLHLPTDWLTPSNTQRDLLRQLWAIFGFANQYFVISGGHSLWDALTLDTRYRNIPTQERAWFDAVVTAFGANPGTINQNATIRQLLKLASDRIARPFVFGGVTI